MLEEFAGVMKQSADLSAEALRLLRGYPPTDPGYAVLASALRENRDALRSTGAMMAALWDEAFAAGRAAERGQPLVPEAPPERHLRRVG